ncbi:hypothetical protein [uncultured Gammaproteobacteria bacterium]|nr:hypothetical protein [uncultured Gammaproteobacteria bacterium]
MNSRIITFHQFLIIFLMLILSSKSYVSKQGAKLGIDSVRRNAPDAQVKDLT